MPAPKKVSKRKIVSITAEAVLGASHRDLMKRNPDVSERTIRVLRQNAMSVEEWRSLVTQKVRAAADESLDAYRDALAAGKIGYHQLALNAAIMLDKAEKFEARQSLSTTQVNILVNESGSDSRTREQIIAALGGEPLTQTLSRSFSCKTVGIETDSPAAAAP